MNTRFIIKNAYLSLGPSPGRRGMTGFSGMVLEIFSLNLYSELLELRRDLMCRDACPGGICDSLI